TAEAAGAAGGRLVRKGRSMGDRVARLGLALDDAETRADRTGGKASKGLRARSGQRLNLPCAKRHIKIIRSMTLGDAGAAAGNVTPGGGVIGAYASVGAGSTGPNGLNTKTNGLRGPSGVGGKSAGAARALPASQSAGGVTVDSATLVPAAAAAATATSATAAGATPVEGAVSLKTIGKTVAFLAKFAAPANEGRDADGGAFGGGGKIAGGGGGRSSYGLRQSWYSAAAAKAISEEAPEEGGDLEDEGEAALALERLLHAPPALQFLLETRTHHPRQGSTITYGSTITLQAFHGGILCFNGKGKAQASALGAQPNALLTVWNLQDLQSKGPVRYGDVLFLQMGRHEVMGSSLIMHKDPKQKEGAQSSAGAGSALSVGTSGEQETEEASSTTAGRAGSSKGSSGGSGGGAAPGSAGVAVGNAVAVPFRGKNMEKAKHTGRWVIFHKDEPEATQGSEVCHLDKVVLMQTWLSLASDRPSAACLKQSGSVDDYCYRPQLMRTSTKPTGIDGVRRGGSGSGDSSIRPHERFGADKGAGTRDDKGSGGERRGSRQDASVTTKSAFTVRPECGWVISGVGDSSGSGKRAGAGGTGGKSSASLSKNARQVVATSAIIQMRSNAQSIVLKAQRTFDKGQRRRLATLGQKFLRAFRREKSRGWLPDRGSDHQLSIVYGPTSPWGKREALRLEREQHKQSAKVTATAKTGGDVRCPTSFEIARAENGALATEAKVKQEVWDALLKRYGYQEVTDMLALMHSASVIRRAVRAMRQRKWTRKLARIDPEIVEKVERLRKIQEQRKANMRGGTSSTSTATGADTATSTINPEGTPVDESSAVVPASARATVAAATATTGGKRDPLTSSVDPPVQRSSRPYEALLAGSLEKFEKGRQEDRDDGDVLRKGRGRPQTTGGGRRARGWGSRESRPFSSGRQCYSAPDGDPTYHGGGVDRIEGRSSRGGGKGLGRVEGCLEQEGGKTRANARPKTAGSGGVEGVLARMRDYEKSVFLEFGGDGMGGAVDQQLSRDVVLLEDLRGTLNQVMAWDHTQGAIDSSSGQEHNIVTRPSPVNGLTPDRKAGPGAGIQSEVDQSQGYISRSSDSAINESVGADSRGLGERIPVSLGRRAGDEVQGGDGDGRASFAERERQEMEPLPPKERQSSADPGIDGAVPNTAAKAATFGGGCGGSGDARGSWAVKQKKRNAAAPLTDDERMSILQHVRPSVFGAPPALGRTHLNSRGGARPQSAVAPAREHSRYGRGGPGGSHDDRRHRLPRASTARRTAREAELYGRSAAVLQNQGSIFIGEEGVSKHGGVLIQDGWVTGEHEPPSCGVAMPTEAAASVRLRGSTQTSRGL
ncbi:unnamed protein product, partial [Scytosiphon promiscuus]